MVNTANCEVIRVHGHFRVVLHPPGWRYLSEKMKDGWLRRRYLWYMKRHKVIEARGKRIGECQRCGRCCGMCPLYDKKTRVCRIYKRRPAICRVFPLTPEDVKNLPKCGFSFRE